MWVFLAFLEIEKKRFLTSPIVVTFKGYAEGFIAVYPSSTEVIFQERYRSDSNEKSGSCELTKLTPFIDQTGTLRIGRRFKHSMLPYECKHIAILPDDHRLTEMIVRKIHQRFQHT